MKRKLIFLAIVVILLEIAWHAPIRSDSHVDTGYRSAALRVASSTVDVLVADTSVLRQQGLSGRASLEANQGMLFVFDVPDFHSFWMKDMRFSLDMIWLGPDFSVVDITKNVHPGSYPKTFYPKEPAQYVLEVNAGWADMHGISIGDHVEAAAYSR